MSIFCHLYGWYFLYNRMNASLYCAIELGEGGVFVATISADKEEIFDGLCCHNTS